MTVVCVTPPKFGPVHCQIQGYWDKTVCLSHPLRWNVAKPIFSLTPSSLDKALSDENSHLYIKFMVTKH